MKDLHWYFMKRNYIFLNIKKGSKEIIKIHTDLYLNIFGEKYLNPLIVYGLFCAIMFHMIFLIKKCQIRIGKGIILCCVEIRKWIK